MTNNKATNRNFAHAFFIAFSLSTIYSMLSAPVQAETAQLKTIEELFDNSMLAVAAYAEFDPGEGSDSQLDRVLRDNEDWSNDLKKIQLFKDRFSLLHHQPDTLSGFSATVFQRKSTNGNGPITFASRGTAGFFF